MCCVFTRRRVPSCRQFTQKEKMLVLPKATDFHAAVNQTWLEALDVNSGRTAKDKNFDETIFLANTEAAAELARQLRLRDLGGLIVVDFIDMRNARHIREVEKQVKALISFQTWCLKD